MHISRDIGSSRRTGRRWVAVGPLFAVLAACSGVTVTKIPWKGDYHSWNDDKQRAIDEIEGTRYYLPWPTLVVTKEFPVAANSCYVPATLSGDGAFILLDDHTIKFLNSGGAQLFTSQTPVAALKGGGAVLEAATSSLATALGKSTKGAAGAEDGGAIRFATDAGGNPASMASESGNGTQPIILSESLSIEYLPDERQQYAVKTRGAVTDAKMQLTNGWMLESADYRVDNSAVIKLIDDTVGSALTAAAKMVPGLQADVTRLTSTSGGSPVAVTVKVHTITFAVPGVYPKLRPEDQDKVESLALEATAKQGDVPPCSPDRQVSTFYPIGVPKLVQFVLQTRGDRYLEVTPATSASTAPVAGRASSEALVTTCVTVAGAGFAKWAKTQNQPAVDTGLVQPKVLSANSGGRVVIALSFAASLSTAQKSAILKELRSVRGNDISGPSCTFPTSQIVVCEAGQAECTAGPPQSSAGDAGAR